MRGLTSNPEKQATWISRKLCGLRIKIFTLSPKCTCPHQAHWCYNMTICSSILWAPKFTHAQNEFGLKYSQGRSPPDTACADLAPDKNTPLGLMQTQRSNWLSYSVGWLCVLHTYTSTHQSGQLYNRNCNLHQITNQKKINPIIVQKIMQPNLI